MLAQAAMCRKNFGIDTTSPIRDRKSTRLNSSHSQISYAVFCLKKKKVSAIWPNDLWAICGSYDGSINGTLIERYNDPCATPTGTYVPPTRTSTATSVTSSTATRTYTPTPTPTSCIAGWAYGPNPPLASSGSLGVWVPQTGLFYLLGGSSPNSPGGVVRNPYT